MLAVLLLPGCSSFVHFQHDKYHDNKTKTSLSTFFSRKIASNRDMLEFAMLQYVYYKIRNMYDFKVKTTQSCFMLAVLLLPGCSSCVHFQHGKYRDNKTKVSLSTLLVLS